jgi:hypothetical protein
MAVRGSRTESLVAESSQSWLPLERTWVIQGLAWLAALLFVAGVNYPTQTAKAIRSGLLVALQLVN